MQAARFHRHGGPDVLVLETVPDPRPGPGQALVRVRACGLNHLDLWVRRGLPRVEIPLPHIPGSDVAGEVVEAPPGFPAPGTRVIVHPGLSCGRCAACLAGDDHLCPGYDVLGYRSDGGCAGLVAVPAVNLVPLGGVLPWTEAAAFPLVFLTAWHMLVARAALRAGETVLVLAAGSGVGHAAVQVAKLHGARVIATAGTDAKASRALDLGADHALNHHRDDLVASVRELTNRRGADVVIEHVGRATWDRSVRCLARGGRLVTCGATTGHDVGLDLRALFARQIALVGSYMGRRAELLAAVRLFEAGRLRPVVDAVYPLKSAADAHRRLEEGGHFGKVVVEIEP